MMVAGHIAYLSRLGGGTEPNTTISPLIGSGVLESVGKWCDRFFSQ
ncbi:hypothetical protein [Limnospira fusiformis]|nr:hypothetical protein HFV01_22285 [Limnospira fusiformis SAG 85.79]